MKKYYIIRMLLLSIVVSCKQHTPKNTDSLNSQETTETAVELEKEIPFFKLSLAQWSLHKAIQEEEMDPVDFAQKAKELGFEGVEYVTQLYAKHLKKYPDVQKSMNSLLDTLKAKSQQYEIQNVLIMVDGEGDLAVTNEKERNTTVENHKKWVDAAAYLGCHAIRVNLFGTIQPEEWMEASTDGLKKLSEYAATKNIKVLVENHGWLSSNAPLLAQVMKNVNMPNCGTLPDFGNFCVIRKNEERWGKCVEEYPKYKGVEEMMPFAKAVSAKSYDFNEIGEETTIDYKKMLTIVKNAGYTGFIGVEYEGENLNEIEGIIATRDLLLKATQQP